MKTLVINGPQGSGKTLLARATAAREGSFCTVVGLVALLTGYMPAHHAKTVIVEDIDGTDEKQLSTLKALVTSEHLSPSRPNFPSRKTPNFIFVTQAHKPLKLGADERRFMVRELGEPLEFDAWHDKHYDDLAIAWAESGRDREGCFDLGRATEDAYDEYVAGFGGEV